MGEQILVRVSHRVVRLRAGSWAKVKSGEQGEGLGQGTVSQVRVGVRVGVRLRVMLRVRVRVN